MAPELCAPSTGGTATVAAKRFRGRCGLDQQACQGAGCVARGRSGRRGHLPARAFGRSWGALSVSSQVRVVALRYGWDLASAAGPTGSAGGRCMQSVWSWSLHHPAEGTHPSVKDEREARLQGGGQTLEPFALPSISMANGAWSALSQRTSIGELPRGTQTA